MGATNVEMDHDEAAFVWLEKLVIAAITDHISRASSWEITKIPFEDHWEVQQLDEETQESFSVTAARSCVDFDLAQDDDPESVTNCYIDFYAFGLLADLLHEHGVRSSFKIDVFNDAHGSNICLTGADDVRSNVGLLQVRIDDIERVAGLARALEAFWLNDLM